MQPRPADYKRVRRAIELALEDLASPERADQPIVTILDLAGPLLGIVGACWHLTDPVSGLPVVNAGLGNPAGTLEWSLVYEYRRPDLNRFDELRTRRAPVAAISTETGGRLGASARFREMVEPDGSADELRVAFVDPFGFWGALVIFTDRLIRAEDIELLSALVPTTSAALRRAAASAFMGGEGAADDGGPSVLILDREDRIVAADPAARRRLALLPEPRPVELPGLISWVSAQARWAADGRAGTARMRTRDGHWLLVNASPLDDRRSGDVAVVIQAAPPASLLGGALRALGLTAREREVAALALGGHAAKTIASTLAISPWTAQDHLKAVYAKAGVGSRAELVSLLPAAG